MTTIMKQVYRPAEKAGFKYPCYTLFMEERMREDFTEETVYGIIRNYGDDSISVNLCRDLDSAYELFKLFCGK